MNQYKYGFTVFTSVYNRANTLHRVFDSLMMQTFRDFEWIVIDNGSTKNCEELKALVEEWKNRADFPIRFILLKKNIGWHGAFNHGVEKAQGELFFNMDSDDSCKPNALERFKRHWTLIPDNIKEQYSGVTGLCCDQAGNSIGNRFPKDSIDSNALEIKYKYHVSGEKKGVIKTDILKQFPFPDFEGNFETDIIWRKISHKYKTRYINETLVTWYINEEGRTDQLSFHSRKKQAAPGLSMAHKEVLNSDISWFLYAPKEFFRSSIHYTRFSLHAGINLIKQLNNLTNVFAKILWLGMLPAGVFVFLKDKHKIFNFHGDKTAVKPDTESKHHGDRPAL